MTAEEEKPSANPAPAPAPAAAAAISTAHPHHHAFHKWHADVLVDGHDVSHGFVKDISMHGAKLFLDHNLQNVKQVRLQIHIPPLQATAAPHVIEVTAKVSDTIYDSDEEFFRSGVTFIKFLLESDSAYLESRINN